MEDKIIDIESNVELPNTSSSIPVDTGSVIIPKLGKEIRMKNLKSPWKKGESGNKGRGKPKGAASFPHAVDRVLERQRIDKIAEVLVATAESGSHRSIETILRLGQAPGYTDKNISAQVNINNNTLNITSDIIEMAKQILKERDAKK